MTILILNKCHTVDNKTVRWRRVPIIPPETTTEEFGPQGVASAERRHASPVFKLSHDNIKQRALLLTVALSRSPPPPPPLCTDARHHAKH